MNLTDILTAAASGPDAVKTLCAPLSDDALRAEINALPLARATWEKSNNGGRYAVCGICRKVYHHGMAQKSHERKHFRERAVRIALAAELSRRSLVDPGWECDCGHVNPDDAEHCAGEKCVAFREWAAQQPQEDQ